MNSLKVMIFCFVFSIFVSSAMAKGMPSYQVPRNISVHPNGTLEVIFAKVINKYCTNGGGRRIYIRAGNAQGVTRESIKQIQSLVMSAFMGNRPININYDRKGSVCEGGKVSVK